MMKSVLLVCLIAVLSVTGEEYLKTDLNANWTMTVREGPA
jgi:Flp pilus assembly pilin Flp